MSMQDRQRIAELEAQVTRLQRAFKHAHGYVEEDGFFAEDSDDHPRWGLQPGDMDPIGGE